ncbi:hypothetical protein KY305_11280 [Bacillus sp. YC2]|uniref:hypothetical protein n=1 Tax=Bacillus sp. YC2 TaxID=2861287 RepID=UPI001CA6EA57|nr:hypothetical protein [Bacillus sp. YC2]MBY8913322.1 hypothetical protein [Bacillus sp. YC2]
MPFTKELPKWGNPGQRPPQTSIEQGYKPMDHPPADWFNWYQYTAYQALKELQEIGATKDDISSAVSDAKAYTDKHEKRTDNPHKTTKVQVGLGNVDNVQQASKADFDAHTKDNDRHITATERSNWNAKETITGAQLKADNSLTEAKKYTDVLEKKQTDLTWFAPTLLNSWSNYIDANSNDQTVFKTRYTKDVTGTVFVEGAIAKGKIGFGIPAFILPIGYRPARAFQWVGVSSQVGMSGIPQTYRGIVDTEGKVIIENCSNTANPNDYISLGFSFKAV